MFPCEGLAWAKGKLFSSYCVRFPGLSILYLPPLVDPERSKRAISPKPRILPTFLFKNIRFHNFWAPLHPPPPNRRYRSDPGSHQTSFDRNLMYGGYIHLSSSPYMARIEAVNLPVNSGFRCQKVQILPTQLGKIQSARRLTFPMLKLVPIEVQIIPS